MLLSFSPCPCGQFELWFVANSQKVTILFSGVTIYLGGSWLARCSRTTHQTRYQSKAQNLVLGTVESSQLLLASSKSNDPLKEVISIDNFLRNASRHHCVRSHSTFFIVFPLSLWPVQAIICWKIIKSHDFILRYYLLYATVIGLLMRMRRLSMLCDNHFGS